MKSIISWAKNILGSSLVSPVTIRCIIFKYLLVNLKRKLGFRLTDTPWVCVINDSEIEKQIDYVDEVFSDYFEHSSLSRNDVPNKRILEIGPGRNLGVAIRFLLAGASRVDCIDKFSSAAPVHEQFALYSRMRNSLNSADQEAFDGIIQLGDQTFEINPDRLTYSSHTTIEKYDAKEYDVILSRAVLEHVFDVDSAMDAMCRMLKPDGIMVHEIDFRDHGIFTRYGLNDMTFLTVPDRTWNRMSSHIGAPNRQLLPFYEGKMKQHNLAADFVVKQAFNSTENIYVSSDRFQRNIDAPCIQRYRSIHRKLLPRYRCLEMPEILPSVIILSTRKGQDS